MLLCGMPLDIRKTVVIDYRPLNMQPLRPMVVWLDRHEPHELENMLAPHEVLVAQQIPS